MRTQQWRLNLFRNEYNSKIEIMNKNFSNAKHVIDYDALCHPLILYLFLLGFLKSNGWKTKCQEWKLFAKVWKAISQSAREKEIESFTNFPSTMTSLSWFEMWCYVKPFKVTLLGSNKTESFFVWQVFWFWGENWDEKSLGFFIRGLTSFIG